MYAARLVDGIVEQVIVGDAGWATENLGGQWKQLETVVGVGWTYDEQRDAFVPPKPFPSWVLNEVSSEWEAPVQYPDDGKVYEWDEYGSRWVAA